MNTLWLATSNKNKIKEFKHLLKGFPFELRMMEEVDHEPPDETGKTFLDNAKIKLIEFQKKKPQSWILAEDGGIEIDALSGRPGVYSGRYFKKEATWPERLEALLLEMKDIPEEKRSAQMTSVILASAPDGTLIQSEGVVKGSIAFSIRGNEGFAYDWVFIPQGQKQTIGELGSTFKNKISHRAIATNKFIEQLNKILV